MSKIIHFPTEKPENYIATLLRGFAAQIQQLKKPKLSVVKEIAVNTGLVVMTRAEYEKILSSASNLQQEVKSTADDVELTLFHNQQSIDKFVNKQSAIILLLGSSLNADSKLIKIAELVKT